MLQVDVRWPDARCRKCVCVCKCKCVSVSGKCVCESVRVCSNQAIMILAWRALDIYTHLQDPKALDGLLYLTAKELLCNLGPFVRPTQSRRRTSSFWPGESKSQGLRLPQADSWDAPHCGLAGG